MYFKDSIPEKLQEFPNVTKLTDTLDALQDFKQESMAEAFRVNNSGVLMDRKWLVKKLTEFGIPNFPVDYPIQPMRQLLLNADTVCRTRGSKIGIELYCSVLSLGDVTVDDNNFYSTPTVLLLDSLQQGYICGDNDKPYYYLIADNDLINPLTRITITIRSKFFDDSTSKESRMIRNYITANIAEQLGFSPNKSVSILYRPKATFYFHKLLNPYFI